jgi:hypothetical protein
LLVLHVMPHLSPSIQPGEIVYLVYILAMIQCQKETTHRNIG